MLQEIRHALRLLVKNPLFALVGILTLALGIGATTAVFTLVNALLIRPLPYEDPARLVLLFEHFKDQHLDAIPGLAAGVSRIQIAGQRASTSWPLSTPQLTTSSRARYPNAFPAQSFPPIYFHC